MSYRDSEMLSPGPEPTAAVPGTSVLVEDLFYNVPNRRKAMGSASEEYNRIWDVVAKYSVYCTGALYLIQCCVSVLVICQGSTVEPERGGE